MSDSSQGTLFDLWFELTRILRKRFWTIRTFFGVTILVVAVGLWIQTPIYQASASVLIDMETPNVLAVSHMTQASTVRDISYMTYADYYRTQIEIMGSRTIADEVFKNLNLSENPVYANAEDPVGLLMEQVTIEPVKQTRLAKVHVEDRDPEQAARISNELATIFAMQNLQRTTRTEAVTLMKNEYLRLQTREMELSKRYKAKHPTIERLRREMKHLEETIDQRSKHPVGLASGVLSDAQDWQSRNIRPNNIRVQDLAAVPLYPIRPKKKLGLLLGLVLGLLGGVGAAVTQELLDPSLRGPEDIERDPNLTLLGHVPAIQGHPTSLLDGEGGFSPSTEAYRFIRTSLNFSTLNKQENPAVVFTSPGSEEGKTTTVSNLGISMARYGVKTLLVDADLRRGRMDEVFGLRQSPGLSEYLAGKATLEQIIQETRTPRLFVVTAGTFPDTPAELVGSRQMEKFVEMVSKQFGWVFLDTPPVIAVTDAIIMAGITRTVVAVAQSGRTHRQALTRLVKACEDARASVLGVILNKVASWNAPSYYQYSSYGYKSKESSSREPAHAARSFPTDD